MMKKTLTITLHNSQNCGSSLQTYALQRFLLSNGVENMIIDYCPIYRKSIKDIFKNVLKRIIYYKDIKTQKLLFLEFNKKNLKLTTKTYRTYKQLESESFDGYTLITGSDQLWNMMYDCGNDLAYYLAFFKGDKISYSVSVGRENIPLKNIERISNYCRDFKWISLRESSSVDQVKKVVNCDVDWACDPTLLIDKNQYKAIEEKVDIKDDYIFVYLAQGVDERILNSTLNHINHGKKYLVVFAGTFHPRCKCDFHYKDINPGSFLGLIHNASYVISNSFHATVFSLIYSKNFGTILPPQNGERIMSLLRLVDLEKHAISDDGIKIKEIAQGISPEKYKDVQNILDRVRLKSGCSLLEHLK